MSDNWGFVILAYGFAAFVIAGYWRRLARQERAARAARPAPKPPR